MISEDLPNPKRRVKDHQLRQQREPGRSRGELTRVNFTSKESCCVQASNKRDLGSKRAMQTYKYIHTHIYICIPSVGQAACSEAVSAERLIICCGERVGMGLRGSGSGCPSPGGVAGWMISLTKGIFCNPFPAVPGSRLTEGHRDSLGELAGGCREVAECLRSAHMGSQAAGQGAGRARVGLQPRPPHFRAAFSVSVVGTKTKLHWQRCQIGRLTSTEHPEILKNPSPPASVPH